jgi:hypothetical protein
MVNPFVAAVRVGCWFFVRYRRRRSMMTDNLTGVLHWRVRRADRAASLLRSNSN